MCRTITASEWREATRLGHAYTALDGSTWILEFDRRTGATVLAPVTIGAPNALELCNACDAAPMAQGQQEPGRPGYCAECLAESAEEL